MADQVRVRFAPSPTGNMHIGGLRTALFNWLFAQHYSGTFLIRIEDTDRERSEEKYVSALLDALAWVGIQSDETILFQSQRQDAYHYVVKKLLEEKKAYRCFCSSEDLEQRVRASGNTDEHYGYDGFCRSLLLDPEEKRLYGIRFALPETIEEIVVHDIIRGTVVFERNQLDDFIIFRSDGTPMYNFAVVVDDAYSQITHIIRGEEHLSNTPKQILLYQACNFSIPQFAHIPMILAPDGSKLSKRYGAVDVLSYRQSGYLPDALINYIARLGWSYGDQEEFTRQELIQYFSLEGVGKKGAIFDVQKLEWLNSVYIRKADVQGILNSISGTEAQDDFDVLQKQYDQKDIQKALLLYQSRVKTIVQLVAEVKKIFTKPATYHQEDVAQYIHPETRVLLQKTCNLLQTVEEFSVEVLTKTIKLLCEQESIKLVQLAQPLRIALTGSSASPGVFELLALVGKQESCERIEAFCAMLT